MLLPEYDIASLYIVSSYCFETKSCARRPGAAASAAPCLQGRQASSPERHARGKPGLRAHAHSLIAAVARQSCVLFNVTRVAQTFRHPNLLGLEAFEFVGEDALLLFEYYPRGTLQQLVAGYAIPLSCNISILICIEVTVDLCTVSKGVFSPYACVRSALAAANVLFRCSMKQLTLTGVIILV
jgi:hypothetical protein